MNKNFSTLFITRKHPPQFGGMENFSYGLIKHFPGKKISVVYGGKQKWLLFIYPWLFLKGLFFCMTKRVDIIHLSDGVMTVQGFVLKLLTRKKVVFTAHGKDINLKFKLYQLIMPFFFKRMDHIYCVSNSTKKECVKVGVKKEKCTVIPNGVNVDEFVVTKPINILKDQIQKQYSIDLKEKNILLTVGRLSKRKGVLWFVENVMPTLDKEFIYILVGGDSTEVNDLKSWFGVKGVSHGEKLKKRIKKLNLGSRVFWLGSIPFNDLKVIFNISDIFVMPNIPVQGDMEGFGIVAIEAGSTGSPVVASRLEGICDAIIENKTGSLVTSRNTDEFKKAIHTWIKRLENKETRSTIRDLVKKHFSWNSVTRKYYNEFMKIVKKQ